MSGPRLPKVRVLTDEEKAEREVGRRKAALESELRKRLDQRSSDPASASRYDLLADAVMNAVSDQLFHAITGPGFAEDLARRGFAVAVLPDGDPPVMPDDWAADATDLYGWTGELTHAVEHLDDLWKRAWLAGYATQEAQEHVETEPVPDQAVQDAAWAQVWLHGDWRWITGKMTMEQREPAAAAVERWGARLDEESGDGPQPRSGIRWWEE